jgi:hypothetical protein
VRVGNGEDNVVEHGRRREILACDASIRKHVKTFKVCDTIRVVSRVTTIYVVVMGSLRRFAGYVFVDGRKVWLMACEEEGNPHVRHSRV